MNDPDAAGLLDPAGEGDRPQLCGPETRRTKVRDGQVEMQLLWRTVRPFRRGVWLRKLEGQLERQIPCVYLAPIWITDVQLRIQERRVEPRKGWRVWAVEDDGTQADHRSIDFPVQDRQCFCVADSQFTHASHEVVRSPHSQSLLRCWRSGHEGPVSAPRFDEPSELELSISLCNGVGRQAEIGRQLSHRGQPDGLLEAPAIDAGGKLDTHLLERWYR